MGQLNQDRMKYYEICNKLVVGEHNFTQSLVTKSHGNTYLGDLSAIGKTILKWILQIVCEYINCIELAQSRAPCWASVLSW
jgi:hypothetical protein